MAAQAGVAQDHGASTEGLGAVPPPATHPVYSTYRNYECYLLPEGGAVRESVLRDLSARVAKAVDFARRREDFLMRDEEARALWADVYPRLSDGHRGQFGAVTARSEAQVLRLSLVYALLDCSPVIKAEHLVAALAVWDYCEASARYIFGDKTGNDVADRIVEALRARGPMSRSAIIDAVFKNHIAADALDQALDVLLEGGLVERTYEDTAGRPREMWAAL